MLSPKRTKFRKAHKGHVAGKATRCNTLSFGEFGLQCMEPGWITARQIEASRVAMTRSIKRGGKVWIRVYPHKPVTVKPAETRMGSGKGNPEFWVAPVKPGTMVFEMEGVTKEIAEKAFTLALHKLPLKMRIVSRTELIL
jgi:large subunit ribosomal protein L16